MQMRNMKDEISEKKRQMRLLERRIVGNGEVASNNAAALELSQARTSNLQDSGLILYHSYYKNCFHLNILNHVN